MANNLVGYRVELLDKGWVELLDLMPHPDTGVSGDLAIVNAARTSFLGESKGEEKDKKLLFYLLQHGHTSPFEMVEFKFLVRAPLVVWWQWVRHRTWNYNAQSGRHTPFEEDDFYVPAVWRKQAPDNKQASQGQVDVEQGHALTPKLVAHYKAAYQLYQKALAAGVAKELARLFLPGFSVYYTWVAKVDAHNLMRFCSCVWPMTRNMKSGFTRRPYTNISSNPPFPGRQRRSNNVSSETKSDWTIAPARVQCPGELYS